MRKILTMLSLIIAINGYAQKASKIKITNSTSSVVKDYTSYFGDVTTFSSSYTQKYYYGYSFNPVLLISTDSILSIQAKSLIPKKVIADSTFTAYCLRVQGKSSKLLVDKEGALIISGDSTEAIKLITIFLLNTLKQNK